ncbi:MAG: peptide chain release factor N(5)-glutamine methyltransferase [Verrucomicrobia bacterium]|nr:peptide chain release factor N(5)-glutamine methyltransferase [Verrucomicrobiota bacterium]
MTVREVIQRSTEFLQRHGVDFPRLQAELLLAHLLKLPRLQLYLNHDRALAEPELTALRALVQRRSKREPLQHLVGSTSFVGLEIAVSPAALIPRPETETLAELAAAALSKCATPAPVALDFGTGTGCLAIALATRCKAAQVHALDISEAALTLARANAQRHGLAERIVFHLGDGFGALPEELRCDLIVSNPPYIPTAEIATLQAEVRDFDPRAALDGGADGLDFYRLLARESPAWLNVGGGLFAEFGDGQETALQLMFNDSGWRAVVAHRDLTERPRVLEAWR